VPLFWFLFIWYLATLVLWVLAFWPTDVNPDWLFSAQVACFGTLENGIPDTYGWIKLIATPLTFLIMLFVFWSEDFFFIKKIIFSDFSGKTFCFILLFIVFCQGVIVGKKIIFAKKIETIFNPAQFGTLHTSLVKDYPRTFKIAPYFELTDHNGRKFGTDNVKGKVTYLTFAFTRCKSICPLLINTVRTAVSKSEDLNRELIIISLDPWRETINNVSNITKNLKLNIREHYLVGSLKEIKKVLNEYKVPRARDLKAGEIIHPGLVYVLDPKGRIAYTFNSPSSKWLIEAGDRVALKAAY